MTKAYFPMTTMRITQGYGVSVNNQPANTYSHLGSYALDLAGVDGGNDWLYAPCDCVVKRIYGTYNSVWFESLEPIDTIGSKVIFQCLHMNNADKTALGVAVGKIFQQGEPFYREGVAGNVTGAHCHFEIGLAPFTGTGWHTNSNGVWEINNKLIPSDVLTVKRDCAIVNNGGYLWQFESADPLSSSPIYMTCIASGGDGVKICSKLAELSIEYGYKDSVICTKVAVSPADQIALLNITPVGVAWSEYMPKEVDDVAALRAAIEQIKGIVSQF